MEEIIIKKYKTINIKFIFCKLCNNYIIYLKYKQHNSKCDGTFKPKIKIIRYCKNEKCNKGENNTKKILIKSGAGLWCCIECKRINKNLPLYCSNLKCDKGENGAPKELTYQNKYCSNECVPHNGSLNKKKSKESKLKQSKTRKRKFESGELKVWNKGLTRETDERVAKLCIKGGETQKILYKNGEMISWIKGLTKYNDERVTKLSKNVSKTLISKYKSGEITFNGISKVEIEFGIKIKEIFNIELESSYWIENKCYDYKVPNKKILIECDGSYWHSLVKAKENDIYKNILAEKYGYKLYRFKLDKIEEIENIINNNKILFLEIFN